MGQTNENECPGSKAGFGSPKPIHFANGQVIISKKKKG